MRAKEDELLRKESAMESTIQRKIDTFQNEWEIK